MHPLHFDVQLILLMKLQMLSRTGGREADRGSPQNAAILPYSEMQKSMMDQLEQRRQDWEKEMHRIQEDFFQVWCRPLLYPVSYYLTLLTFYSISKVSK